MPKRVLAGLSVVLVLCSGLLTGCTSPSELPASGEVKASGEIKTETIMLPGSVPLTMVGIPATFMMGSTNGDLDAGTFGDDQQLFSIGPN